MTSVAYFTAVVARVGGSWRMRDLELDEGGSLEDLADELRSVGDDDEPVLALLEHEDEWFAIFRVDGDEDPRVFVSDRSAASGTAYADLLEPASEAQLSDDDLVVRPASSDSVSPDEDDEESPESQGSDEEPAALGRPGPPPVWGGDPELLDDLGVSALRLRSLVKEHEEDPAAALAELGEQVGFGPLLETLR